MISKEHAKVLLRTGESMLDTVIKTGFSGPRRLHDLCVSIEAASPGELEDGGHVLEIVFGFVPTPFGDCLLGESKRGVCYLAFIDAGERNKALSAIHKKWTEARLVRDDRAATHLGLKIFTRQNESRSRKRFRAFVKGTSFQLQVWRALLLIPPGCLVTYGRLAAAIGQPNASRAVGNAIGQNSLAYLIPCHRVIRETGALGGYRWSPARKSAIVAWETASSTISNSTHD